MKPLGGDDVGRTPHAADVSTSGTRTAGPLGRHIVVVGSTGSGKSTIASQLAVHFGLTHIELDALYWDPNWTPASRESFRGRVIEALDCPGWVVDGNYSQARDIIWPRAETLVWLDYSLPVILLRLLRRTVRRVATREELWNGNRDRFISQFQRDSIFLWALQTYRRRRRQYTELLAGPEFAHLRVVRLTVPRAAEAWLRGVD